MARVIPATKVRLLVALSRAWAVWPDIQTTLEFKIALWLFLMFATGLAVLGFVGSCDVRGGRLA